MRLSFLQVAFAFCGAIGGWMPGTPMMYLQRDYPMHAGPSEYWQPQPGNCAAAASALVEAFSR